MHVFRVSVNASCCNSSRKKVQHSLAYLCNGRDRSRPQTSPVERAHLFPCSTKQSTSFTVHFKKHHAWHVMYVFLKVLDLLMSHTVAGAQAVMNNVNHGCSDSSVEQRHR